MKKSDVTEIISEILQNITYKNIATKYGNIIIEALEKNNVIVPPSYIKENTMTDEWEEAQGWEPESEEIQIVHASNEEFKKATKKVLKNHADTFKRLKD